MTNRQRLQAVLHGKKADRMPIIEWAPWWHLTVNNWRDNNSNLPNDLVEYYGLDAHCQVGCGTNDETRPAPVGKDNIVFTSKEHFEEYLPHFFQDYHIENMKNHLRGLKDRHDKGEIFVWFTFDGYFWFPRGIMGIENHLLAFYDQPELMKCLNEHLCNFQLKVIDALYEILTPDYFSFAEDMSYNHGPMISKEQFDEFMAPYYNKIIPAIKKRDTKVLIDTDGFVEPLIQWFKSVGIDGILPLERQAGVDVNRIRNEHPDFIMLGGFDKTVMKMGEAAMRQEFERILPGIKAGRYIASCDHQTPPDVSEENYKIYVQLLKEYANAYTQGDYGDLD